MRKQTCSYCDGSGNVDEVVEYKKACWKCNGRGWYRRIYHDVEKIPCKRCRGKGSTLYQIIEINVCSQCNGQGYIIIDKESVFFPETTQHPHPS